ncbi:hypothetical protein B0H19DRAFT_1149571 [Mycena capillaripes]|nr:hypothetical protein B0H19DRAFT_1149571 [Mycena capillaripes]
MSASNSSASDFGTDSFLDYYGLKVAAYTSGVLVETIFTSEMLSSHSFNTLFSYMLCSGLYGVIFALAVYSIFRNGFKSRASVAMLGIVIYLYASALTMWALNTTVVFRYIHILFMDISGTPISDIGLLQTFSSPTFLPAYTHELLYMLNMIVGDSVVVWRVWVLFPRRRWVVLIPSFMLLLSFFCGAVFLVAYMMVVRNGAAGWMAVFHDSGLFISWIFSLATNVSCTIILGIKAWHHRRMVRTLCTSRRMATEKVLSLLVECGFIYCLFWLTQLVQFFTFFTASTATLYAQQVLGDLGDQVSGMYPTLIIVIVNFRRTIWDDESSLNTDQRKHQTKNTVSEFRWASPSEISGSTPMADNSVNGVEEKMISPGDGKEVPSEMV